MELNGVFAVEPKLDCPHVDCIKKKPSLTVALAGSFFTEKGKSGSCEKCDGEENWICATCEAVLCSRFVEQHMEQHFFESDFEHAVATSLSDLSTWCYKCNSYIVCPEIQELRTMLYIGKFGCVPPELYQSTKDDNGASCPKNEKCEDLEEEEEEDQCGWRQLRTRRTEYPEPVPRTLPDEVKNTSVNNGKQNYGHLSNESIQEYEDTEVVLQKKIEELASLLSNSEHCVVYTGAGISTRYLPDYRGPGGVWTMKDRGLPVKKQFDLSSTPATEAHMALATLTQMDLVKCIVSTNVDGLHLKSGIPENRLCELHGNCFKEECAVCGRVYTRLCTVHDQRVKSVPGHAKGLDHPRVERHITGRLCDDPQCNGVLLDNIIHFNENLPEEPLEKAYQQSNEGDLALVVGTSMRVQPACSLPVMIANKKDGKMVIINYQKTPYDQKAFLRIWADAEVVLPSVTAILTSHEK